MLLIQSKQFCTKKCVSKILDTPRTKLTEWMYKFKNANIFEADISAEIIISHALGKKMFNELSHEQQNVKLTQFQSLAIDQLCKKRLENQMPLQYIIGEWDFRKINLKMKSPVFIPRPETELLVDVVNMDIKESNKDYFNLLEVGCGSGPISLSLIEEQKKRNKNTKSKKQLEVVAIDANLDAVNLTKHNYNLLNIDETINFSIIHKKIEDFIYDRQFDGIVSNPPYIPSAEMEKLQTEVFNHESHLALNGGRDGLYVIRQILEASKQILKVGGWIWLEIDESHPKKLHQEIPDNFKVEKFEEDIFDVIRFVKIVKVF